MAREAVDLDTMLDWPEPRKELIELGITQRGLLSKILLALDQERPKRGRKRAPVQVEAPKEEPSFWSSLFGGITKAADERDHEAERERLEKATEERERVEKAKQVVVEEEGESPSLLSAIIASPTPAPTPNKSRSTSRNMEQPPVMGSLDGAANEDPNGPALEIDVAFLRARVILTSANRGLSSLFSSNYNIYVKCDAR